MKLTLYFPNDGTWPLLAKECRTVIWWLRLRCHSWVIIGNRAELY